jgi:hypothetical protein
LFPQEPDWSPPVLLLKHGEKGDKGADGIGGTSGVNGIDGNTGAPGAPGAAGGPGADGTSIVWLGEAIAHPVNAVNGQAYKNTTDGRSYVFYDPAWYQMTIDGVDGQQGADGLPIVWKGESIDPPENPEVNWAYRDLNNGRIYICVIGGEIPTWELMVLDGSDGADGAPGADGLSVYITYHDGSVLNPAPTLPTNVAGDNNGWHTAATVDANWMSQKVDDGTTANWGAAIRIKGLDGAPGQDLTYDLTVPPTPTGLAAISYYAKIGLEWAASPSDIHSHTEIWRSTIDDLATAEYVESSTSAQYMDSPPVLAAGVTYYYWIRFASTSRVFGLFNAVSGVAGSVASDPSYMLEVLAGKLGYGQFDVANGIFPVRVVAALPTLPNALWPNYSTALLTTEGKLYRVVAGAWTKEVDGGDVKANSIIAGKIAAGAIIASHIGANEIIANVANIKTGMITDAHIGSLNADKINAGALSAQFIDSRGLSIKNANGDIILAAGTALDFSNVGGATKPANNATVGATIGTNLSGKMTAANISTWIADLAVGNAQIGNTIQSNNFSAGSSGWRILKDGTAEFNGIVMSRYNVVAQDTVFPTNALMYGQATYYDEFGYPYLGAPEYLTFTTKVNLGYDNYLATHDPKNGAFILRVTPKTGQYWATGAGPGSERTIVVESTVKITSTIDFYTTGVGGPPGGHFWGTFTFTGSDKHPTITKHQLTSFDWALLQVV